LSGKFEKGFVSIPAQGIGGGTSWGPEDGERGNIAEKKEERSRPLVEKTTKLATIPLEKGSLTVYIRKGGFTGKEKGGKK